MSQVGIYLVDDHAIVRDGLRSMLEAGGYAVVGEASNATAALADVARLKPDLLLLDLNLGGRSGIELLAEVQRRSLPVRCIVLTMSDQPRHVAEALRLGAVGYLLKGSSRTVLMDAIAAVAAGKRFFGPEVGDLAAQALAAGDQADPLGQLSPREREIITMVVKGESSPVIAEKLHLSPKTVDSYRSRLMAKLGVDDITALVRFAIRHGLIDVDGA